MACELMSLFLHRGTMPAQDADATLCIRPSWSRSFECRGDDERAKTRGGARATMPLDNRASASRTARLYIVASTSWFICGIETREQPETSGVSAGEFFPLYFLPGAALRGLGLHEAATSAYRTGAVPFPS